MMCLEGLSCDQPRVGTFRIRRLNVGTFNVECGLAAAHDDILYSECVVFHHVYL